MIQPEHHQGVSVGEDALINRQAAAGLINALEHRNGMTGDLFRDALKIPRGAMEQLQGAGNPLQELGRAPFGPS